jgi:hypothetical protein
VSELKHHVPNNAELYPSRELQTPGPIITQTGAKEWEIERILDKQTRGCSHQYLVCWHGYGPEADVWVPGKELDDTHVLQEYITSHADEEARDTKQRDDEDRSDEETAFEKEVKRSRTT